ncbi:HD domain-containing protein [Thioclava sp. GXIMD4215]|uniref:HD domain-containing protein n=1 Tax=Thioclava sp. GXIMD4215 TaxID=3131928 RepID=UPI003247E4F5
MHLSNILRSGYVQRWHTNADLAHIAETNSSHQWAATMIALALDPQASRATILAVLTHDVGEMWAGDLPYDFKRDNPDIASRHAIFEVEQRNAALAPLCIEGPDLNLVGIADRVAAVLHVAQFRPDIMGNSKWARDTHDVRKQLAQCSYPGAADVLAAVDRAIACT